MLRLPVILSPFGARVYFKSAAATRLWAWPHFAPDQLGERRLLRDAARKSQRSDTDFAIALIAQVVGSDHRRLIRIGMLAALAAVNFRVLNARSPSTLNQ